MWPQLAMNGFHKPKHLRGWDKVANVDAGKIVPSLQNNHWNTSENYSNNKAVWS